MTFEDLQKELDEKFSTSPAKEFNYDLKEYFHSRDLAIKKHTLEWVLKQMSELLEEAAYEDREVAYLLTEALIKKELSALNEEKV